MARFHSAIDDPSNPFFIHPSDSPGQILVSQPLTGENYNSWSQSMKMALNAKNKFGFFDGTISKPADEDFQLLSSWERNNNIVSSWLLNSVSKELVASIIYADSAAAIWMDLKDRFQQKNAPRIYQLKKDLINLQQGSMTVNQYFTKLKGMWEELNDFRPNCNCTCGGTRSLLDHTQQEYVLVFLMGLNDAHAQTHSQILLMDPLPSITKVYSLLVQDERQQDIGTTFSQNPDSQVVFAVKSATSKNADSRSKNGKKDRPTCTHRGLIGHTMDKCYRIHGYPPGYKFKKSSNSSTTVHQVSDSAASSQDVSSMLTTAQYKQLISLLSSQMSQAIKLNVDPNVQDNSEGQQSLEDD